MAAAASAESLYRDHVWPALWDVLQTSSAAVTTEEQQQQQQQRSRALQHAVTHALVQLLAVASPGQYPDVRTLESVSSQLLLHARGAPLSPPSADLFPGVEPGILGSTTTSLYTPASATAAVEIERLFVLLSTAIQLGVQTDMAVLSDNRVPASAVTGPVEAATSTRATTAATSTAALPVQLPLGVTLASRAVVAGIGGVSRHLANVVASVTAAPLQHVQPLWFTFLFFYLQQLSAHTPKDTTLFASFFEGCGKEYARRVTSDPMSSDEDATDLPLSDASCPHCGPRDMHESELAALQAWSQVSPDLLKDVIARTRFRRAALLFKSFVPHMTTQAPTLMFLLVDLLCEFNRSWEACMQSIPCGNMDEGLAEQLAQFSTRSITHDDTNFEATSSSSTEAATQRKHHAREQRQQCRALIQAYGDRLSRLLGEGVPHAHLVATAVCAVLAALYVVSHTRPNGVSASDVSTAPASAAAAASPLQATTSAASAAAAKAAQAGAATGAAARGQRDEEAAVLEVETAYALPRRAAWPMPWAQASTTSSQGSSSSSSAGVRETRKREEQEEVCVPEAEWRLRHYAPFGQLLAHTHILELQKVHIFSVAATQMRVGRVAAQQAEHVRFFAMVSLYCGVAGWDLALLLYHVAACPLKPFVSPEASPAPALPSAALARYTAAVQQYVEQSHAELIMNTSFVEMSVGGDDGDGSARAAPRRHPQPQQQAGRSAVPSRGELQTPRFIQMVHPDPLLLSWRAHVAAAEMTLAAPTAALSPSVPSTSFAAPKDGVLASGSPGHTAAPGASLTSAAAPALPSDVLLSPCCFIRDLLIAGHYTLAAAGMRYLADRPFRTELTSGAVHSTSLNVLLPPRRAFPHSISVVYYVSVVLRRWLQRWETMQESPLQQEEQHQTGNRSSVAGLRDEMFAVLRSLSPLLSIVQSYLAHQTLLYRLVVQLAWLSKATAAAAAATASTAVVDVFALVEQLLIYVVMPCLRVLPPAVAVYDALDDVVAVFTRFSRPHADTDAVIAYGESPAAPLHMIAWLEALLPSPSYAAMYRTKQQQQQYEESDTTKRGSMWPPRALVYPHDALLRKEREALLSQSLKRLNAENIEEYQAALQPILYAEPLLVAHRLFVQAVGYNNNFLNVHTHLLHGMPRTVLTLVLQQGLVLMARYAAEEKVTDASGESRTAILATFLATLWRDNVDSVDGSLLVRRVEVALRSSSGDDILLGTELCRALLATMAYRTLEHADKYNMAQLQALAVTPSTTSFFGRGAMTSFRMRYWADSGSALLLLSPTDVFVTARRALTEALQQLCVVPLERKDEEGQESEKECDSHNEEEEEAGSAKEAVHPASRVEARLTLGQLILVHLCRLQSRIYELQRDLDGGAELILLSSAERFSTMSDMLVIMEELSPAPKLNAVVDRLCSLVRQVALPPVALYVETQQRRKYAAMSSVALSHTASLLLEADAVYHVAIPAYSPGSGSPSSNGNNEATTVASSAPSVAQQLPNFAAAHFEYTTLPNDAARQEWQQCMQRAQRLLAAHRPSSSLVPSSTGDAARARRAAAIISWLKTEETHMEAEELAHRHLLQSAAPARVALLEAFVRDFVPAAPETAACVAAADDALIDFAVSYLLPRAVLNLREAATVAAFFTWLFQQAETKDTPPPQQVAPSSSSSLLRRATDLALIFVTAAFTYFVAYTDGECKRLGYVLQRLLEIPALSGQQQQRQSVAALSPELLARLHFLFASAKTSSGGGSNDAAADAKNSGKAGETAAAGKGSGAAAAASSSSGRGDENGASEGAEQRSIGSAFFSSVFLGSPATTAAAAAAPSLASSPASILSLSVARGVVRLEADAANDVAGVATRQETPPQAAADDAKPSASASSPSAPSAQATSAIPLQLEAFLCRAMVQLLTHEDDVPAYAQRNQFLVLEQLDKTAFPSTLCAVDVLISAMEPHASKTKSYYALASAVLKSLRVNRRRRQEAQRAVVALGRGETTNAATAAAATAGDERSVDGVGKSADSPSAALPAASTAASESIKESASACHAQWRLREHYMRQLLQAEVARLQSDQQVRRRHEESEAEEEGEEEKSDSVLSVGGHDDQDGAVEENGQPLAESCLQDDRNEENNSRSDSSSFDEEGEAEEEEEEDEEEDEDEEGSGSYSGDSDGESEDGDAEDDDTADQLRKRPREE